MNEAISAHPMCLHDMDIYNFTFTLLDLQMFNHSLLSTNIRALNWQYTYYRYYSNTDKGADCSSCWVLEGKLLCSREELKELLKLHVGHM